MTATAILNHAQTEAHRVTESGAADEVARIYDLFVSEAVSDYPKGSRKVTMAYERIDGAEGAQEIIYGPRGECLDVSDFGCDARTGIRVGSKVKLRRDVDRFPNALVKAGATGTVSEVTECGIDSVIGVKLDETVDGLADWENTLFWCPTEYTSELSVDEPTLFEAFSEDAEVVV